MSWRRFPNRHLVTNRSTIGSKKIRDHNSKIKTMMDLQAMASKEFLLPLLTKSIQSSMSRRKEQCSLKLRSKFSRRFQQKWGQKNRARKMKWRRRARIFRSPMLLSNNQFLVRHQSWQAATLIAVRNLYPKISTRSSSQLRKEIHKLRLSLMLLWVWMHHLLASTRPSSRAGLTSQTSPRPRHIYQCRCGVPVSEIIRHLIAWWLDRNFNSLPSTRTYKETRRSLANTYIISKRDKHQRESLASTGWKMARADSAWTVRTSIRLKSRNKPWVSRITIVTDPPSAGPSTIVNTVSLVACACSVTSTRNFSSCSDITMWWNCTALRACISTVLISIHSWTSSRLVCTSSLSSSRSTTPPLRMTRSPASP